jgi:hypothetical protein
MANSISSELTIATAVSTLGDLLAPISNFTLNINNDVVGRSETVQVPVMATDDEARDYSAGTGYNTSADTKVTKIPVTVKERIKPFHLSDNEMNKSPLTLQSYVKQNAHEFGRYLLNTIFTAVDTSNGATATTKNASAVAIADIKAIAKDLDEEGAPMDRHLLLAASVNSSLMPTSIETFGSNVLEGGRFTSLYGMNVHPQSAFNPATGKIHSFGASSDAIVVVNRLPDTQGAATLEEYTPFTIDGVGIQCAYRRYFDPAKGEHFAAFTSNFGVGVAKSDHISAIKRAS